MNRNDRMDAVKEDILRRINIVDYIGRYTKLTKKGTDFRGRCPLHGGTKANFAVSAKKGTFSCFSECHTSGDIFAFVMAIKKVGFMDAMKELAREAGIEMPTERRQLSSEQRDRRRIQDTAATQRQKWQEIGIHSAADAFRVGGDGDETLTVPVWPSSAPTPTRWLEYQVQAGRPKRINPSNDDENVVVHSSAAVSGYVDELPVVVIDPVVAIRAHEHNYLPVFGVCPPATGSWLSSAALDYIISARRTRTERLGLLIPTAGAGQGNEMAIRLHATERLLLERGIEALLVGGGVGSDLWENPAIFDGVFGWETAHRLTLMPVEDIYERRIYRLAGALRAGKLNANSAMAKAVEVLSPLRSKNHLLYEVYLAWTLRHLPGVDRVDLERACLGQSSYLTAVF